MTQLTELPPAARAVDSCDPPVHDGPFLRVLHVINGEHYAGAEKVQDLLALRLPQRGVQVSFACLRPARFASQRVSQVPLYDVPMKSRVDLRPAWRLRRLIKQQGYHLVHTHTPRSALVGHLAARWAGLPMVHHVHGQTVSELTRRKFGQFSAAVERRSLRHAAALIAVSGSLRRHLIGQGYADDQISVVPNGVPGPPILIPRDPPRHLWTVATVALFRPRKGTEILLESMARLRADGLPVRLRAIGRFETAAYEAEVRRRAAALGLAPHITWTGFTSDVPGALSDCDVMVLPSLLAEGLPMVVVEAMAAGVPAVGTRVDGITDVLQHEQNGLLAEPGSPDDLAHQLARLIRGEVDWRRLRQAGFASHQHAYSDHSMADGVAGTYRKVLRQSPQPATVRS